MTGETQKWLCNHCNTVIAAKSVPYNCPNCRKSKGFRKEGEPVEIISVPQQVSVPQQPLMQGILDEPQQQEMDVTSASSAPRGRPPNFRTKYDASASGSDPASQDELEFQTMIAHMSGNSTGDRSRAIVLRELFFKGNSDSPQWLNKVLLMAKWDRHKRKMALIRWFGKEPSALGVDLNVDIDEADEDMYGGDMGMNPVNRNRNEDPSAAIMRMMQEDEAAQLREQMMELKRLQIQQKIEKAKAGGDITGTGPSAGINSPTMEVPQVDEDGVPIIVAGKPLMTTIPREQYSGYMAAIMLARKNNKSSDSDEKRRLEERIQDREREERLEREKRDMEKMQMQQQQQTMMMTMMQQQSQQQSQYMQALMDMQKNNTVNSVQNKEHEYEERERLRRESELRIEQMRKDAEERNRMYMEQMKQTQEAIYKMREDQLLRMNQSYQKQLEESSFVNQLEKIKQTTNLATNLGIGGLKTPEQAKQELAVGIQGRLVNQVDDGMKEARALGRQLLDQMRKESAQRVQKTDTGVSAEDKSKFFSVLNEKLSKPAAPPVMPPAPITTVSPPLVAPVARSAAHEDALRRIAKMQAESALREQGMPVPPPEALRVNPSLIVNPPTNANYKHESDSQPVKSRQPVAEEQVEVMAPTQQIQQLKQGEGKQLKKMKMPGMSLSG